QPPFRSWRRAAATATASPQGSRERPRAARATGGWLEYTARRGRGGTSSMSRALAAIAVAAAVLGTASLAAPAAPDERRTPLPWLTFPTGPGVSDTQPFQCPNGAQCMKLKLRGATPGGATYGY